MGKVSSKNEIKEGKLLSFNFTENKIGNKEISPLEKEVITNDAYSKFVIENQILFFISINNESIILYKEEVDKIMIFNFTKNTKKELRDKSINTNNNNIIFEHCIDKKLKKDLVIASINNEGIINNISLYDINQLAKIFTIYSPYFGTNVFNSTILNTVSNDKYMNYIISCTREGNIIIFNGNGKFLSYQKEQIYPYFISSEIINNKNFFLIGSDKMILAAEIESPKNINKYIDFNSCPYRVRKVFFKKIKDKDLLFENSGDDNYTKGFIRIWNFHTKLLIKIFNINVTLYGFILYKNKYIISGSDDAKIRIINIENNELVNCFNAHNQEVISIRFIKHDLYGDSFISFSLDKKIKLWSI